MTSINIPNEWSVREYQEPLWNYMADGGKRAAVVWPRRAGKDSVALNFTATQMFKKPGVYWHMAPLLRQVRRIAWEGIDKQGRRIIDQVFPKELRKRTNSSDMLIELVNGAIWQCVGSDSYDALVGSNVQGVVFSEWALADPQAWEYIRPILVENGGWAIFIYTPRGKNHGHDLYVRAKEQDEHWFSELLTVDDCIHDGVRHISAEAIQEEVDSGMPNEMVQQEFYCSFLGGLAGSLYSKELGLAEREGRITKVPHTPRLPVDTYWDIGVRGMAIWFVQQVQFETRVIDYYESTDTNLIDTIKYLRGEKPYAWRNHFFPHDIKTREISTGVARRDIVSDLGWAVNIVPQIPVADGIAATQVALATAWFDAEKCKRGLDCLWNYTREFDDRLRVFKDKPLHNWASHGADAFRMLGVMHKDYEAPKADWMKHQSDKPKVKRSLRN